MFVSLTLAGCVSSAIKPLPRPPEVKTPPTSSAVPDFSGTSIVPVKGVTTTSTIPIRSGSASIRGRVMSGGAPVGGATIRIERFVDDKSTSIDVSANGEGAYAAENIAGGRYRVRAFRPPDATMTEASVFFLGASEAKSLDLNLGRFGGSTDVRASIAPDPPILGEVSRLTVAVSTRGVDSAGTARSIGVANQVVTLITAGGRALGSPSAAVTDGSGRATWTLQCVALDSQGLSVILADGSSYNINVAGCQLPPTTTTVVADAAEPPTSL